MNKNEKYVITLNRELGSGGHTVGRKLAEKLGVNYYDKAVINALTERLGLTVEQIEEAKSKKRSWWDDFKCSSTMQVFCNGSPQMIGIYNSLDNDLPISEPMFKLESNILKEIAERESCVIAGRSGFSIFQEWPNHLNIFIQASLEHRISRVMRKQNMSREEAISIISKIDEGRETYMLKNTQKSRYDTRHYDLVINMDGLTEDQAVEVILCYINQFVRE